MANPDGLLAQEEANGVRDRLTQDVEACTPSALVCRYMLEQLIAAVTPAVCYAEIELADEE